MAWEAMRALLKIFLGLSNNQISFRKTDETKLDVLQSNATDVCVIESNSPNHYKQLKTEVTFQQALSMQCELLSLASVYVLFR